MAKKKRKEEQEEEKYEWTPPDSDEKGFLQKDMRGTKALFISTLLGLALGIIAYLTTGVSAYIGIVVIFGGALLLRQQRKITDDLDALLNVLPISIVESVHKSNNYDKLLEIILDLGRGSDGSLCRSRGRPQ